MKKINMVDLNGQYRKIRWQVNREIKKVIKRYHKLAEIELLNEMDNFTSVQDTTGKFTLRNSNFKAVQNKNRIGLGIQINNKDIEELYKFSQ